MAYAFEDARYGVVMTIRKQGETKSTTKTISGINSTNGEDAGTNAALFNQFAELLMACTTNTLGEIERSTREYVGEVNN